MSKFPTKEPESIPVDVQKSTCKIVSDKEHEDGRLEIEHGGWTFAGILVKDMFRNSENPWHKILPKLDPLYLAFYGGFGHPVLQVDVWYEGEWRCIWQTCNDFDSFAKAKKSEDAYVNFIKSEGKIISKAINNGLSFDEILPLLKKGEHSGNTWGCAWSYGIQNAKNIENAKEVRDAFNKDCGGTGKEDGIINPAVLVLGGKKDDERKE